MNKQKLLYVADAACPTGFARVTHNVIPFLQGQWDVTVLGINYRGDPHTYNYPIYPASRFSREDGWGFARLPALLEKIKPDLIFVNNDPWNVVQYISVLENIKRTDVPLVSYMPVDSPNMRGDIAEKLNKAALNICYTQFGADALACAGADKSLIAIVPHGVDSRLYRPMNREMARKAFGFEKEIPLDSYVVGNVNRNQPRKRLDLTIQYFAAWLSKYKIPDNVYLHLHCKLKDTGWDLLQLSEYFGLKGRVMLTDVQLGGSYIIDESIMPYVYNCFDVQISTTLGEGWGLTTHEGMACGIPQIVPEWSALAEWPKDAVRYVPVSGLQVSTASINTIGGVCSEEGMIKALDQMYRNKDLRDEYSDLAYARATEERFTWASIGSRMLDLLSGIKGGKASLPLVSSQRQPAELLESLETGFDSPIATVQESL